MMPLNHILSKCTTGYKLNKSQEKINHLMYMDDIKLFAKIKRKLEILIHTVRIYSQDIGMKFDIEKYAMLVMKSGKRHMMEGIELPNQEKSERSEKRNLQILGNIWTWHHQTSGDKRKKIEKEYLRRTRKLLETKLDCRNLIKGINNWAVPLVRYSRPKNFNKWTREQI